MFDRQFTLFVLAGGTAAAANFASRIAFSNIMSYAPSISLAYCVGMLTAFTLNRAFVFTDAGNSLHKQVMWFLLVNAMALMQTLLISLFLAKYALPWLGMTFHPEAVAHAIGVAVPVVTSYFGHKHFSFRKNSS